MKQDEWNSLKDRVCVITGGGGVLGSAMARGLASAGVIMAILDINEEAARKVASEISSEFGLPSQGYAADVLDRESLLQVRNRIRDQLGEIDLLINASKKRE